jgi:large subunit ribosomal protein L10
MENPRPEKVSVVEEVRQRLEAADAVLLTEYRGLKVRELEGLRNAIRPAGGEYKVYKNTLVRIAARELGLDADEILTGPTALAFVSSTEETQGDIATVAKAIQDFAKSQPLLLLKGGFLGDAVLDADGAKALASLPTASEVYARLAGAVNGNARGLASVISGVHRSLAYVLQAAIDANVFEGDAPAPETNSASEAEAASEEAEPVAEAAVEAEAVAEATEDAEPTTDESPAADDAAEESEN